MSESESKVEEIGDDAGEELSSAKGLDSEVSKTLAELKILRSSTKGSITRIKKHIFNKGSSISDTELECRLGILESYFKQALNVQISLEKLNIADEVKTNMTNRAEIEELYVTTKTKIMSLLSGQKPNVTLGDSFNASFFSQQPTSRSKLERIRLPTFSGKFSEFPNFIGIFTRLVHNDDSLDALQKFNYLRKCLSGAAFNAIREFDLTDLNYSKALERLKKRFDSKTMMFQEHLNGIRDINKISKCSAFHLRNLEDSFNTHIAAMLSIGSHKEITDAMLIAFALDRVDVETRVKWDEAVDHSTLPSWEDFAKVLNRRCQTLEARESKLSRSESSPNRQTNRSRFRNNSKNVHSTLIAQKQHCEFCSSDAHDIVSCPEFNKLSIVNRFQEVKQRVLCINCLAKGHSVRRCQASKCNICSLPHHRLLHRFTHNHSTDSTPSSSTTHPSVSGNNISLVSSMFKKSSSQVILATALVYMKDTFGKFYPVRALLDSASQLNFITEDMAQKLKLKKVRTHTSVSGIGKSNAVINYKTEASCKSRISDYEINLDLLILKGITNVHPEREMDISYWNIPSNISLADPNFHRPSRIDLLIGADSFFQLLCVGQIKIDHNLPIFQKTLFGWIVSGRYSLSTVPRAACTLIACSDIEDSSLNEIVKKFWEMEEVNLGQRFLSREEKECEETFLKGVRRQEDGRFIVNLLFKSSAGELGDSLGQAKRRFHNLEKRLLKNREVKAQYIEFMKEYSRLGHMEVVPKGEISQIKYFAPHQYVLRPDSLTTKLRVVFDCSAKTTSNLSLNDRLMKGPVIQDDLYDIILRFRSYKYVITADISKMYRQILVQEEDRNYQCILWRTSEQEELKAFRLRTVTYGTTSAPFLATRCLKYLADENISRYPLGAKVIAEDFYMDDLITGGDSLETVFRIYSEVTNILLSAGFDLRKWCSNDKRILEKISCQEVENESLRINDKDVIKTLGIVWNPTDDDFQYIKPSINDSKVITKRLVLSELSQIFDPLGLINPIVVKGKIIMQDLWIVKSRWDESVPVEVHSRWEEFREEVAHIDQIKLPRYIFPSNLTDYTAEIHGFADASIRAYGCCVYLRTIDIFAKTKCTLLSAKSKVAPIKTKSLPRLELCAATLLVDLVLKVLPNLNYHVENIYLWTDSEIVLHWISAYPSSWEIFVANRVSKIQSELPSAIWKYVNTKANPADIVSRGAYSTELNNSIWFCGPQFLYLTEENWPKQKSFLSLADKESNKSISLVAKTDSLDGIAANFVHFSDSQKTNRIFGYILRFYNNLKRRVSKVSNPYVSSSCRSITLTSDELEDAFLRIIWNIQQYHFLEEIEDLRKTKKISPKSVISNLNPFLADEHNLELLRVGGRLQNADIPYYSKCPILLPKNSLFVKNFVVHLHKKNFHAGPQALVGIIRQRFWIINVRNLAKKVVDGCLHCFKYRPKLMQQIMGNLPASRVTISRPFAIAGVDFCGPFHISQKRRGYCTHKAYVAVFICFATKASHLEVVSDLSAQGFIAALKRFVARRGLCEEIHCDNGTNFVGARNELKELHNIFVEQQMQQDISSWCAAQRIRFIHIPPRSPHFGGLWEAAVKSAKFHLYRTVKQAYLTYEEFSTVVAEIEGIMNSRPLCVLSPDPNDEAVLTPGHFLIGVPLNSIPEPSTKNEVPLLNRWRRLTQIKQHFWARWSKEYLLELQRRTKWQKTSENIEVGTLVLIADDNLPPQQWLLGRIEQVIPGTDSKIRVADVRTKGVLIRRPIHRLAPLPKD